MYWNFATKFFLDSCNHFKIYFWTILKIFNSCMIPAPESRYELGPKIITNLRDNLTFFASCDTNNSGLRRTIGTNDTALESIFCLVSGNIKNFLLRSHFGLEIDSLLPLYFHTLVLKRQSHSWVDSINGSSPRPILRPDLKTSAKASTPQKKSRLKIPSEREVMVDFQKWECRADLWFYKGNSGPELISGLISC